jgi:hypothetical protein
MRDIRLAVVFLFCTRGDSVGVMDELNALEPTRSAQAAIRTTSRIND